MTLELVGGDNAFNINLRSIYTLYKHFYVVVKAKDAGVIINMYSIIGRAGGLVSPLIVPVNRPFIPLCGAQQRIMIL